MNKFFKKAGWAFEHPILALEELFNNDDTAGYGYGVIIVLIFGRSIFGINDMTMWGMIVPILTCIGIIVFGGLIYSMLPTGEQMRGEVPFKKSTKYLKWIGILFLFISLGFAWFLRIGPQALLLATTVALLYWVVPDLGKQFSEYMYKQKNFPRTEPPRKEQTKQKVPSKKSTKYFKWIKIFFLLSARGIAWIVTSTAILYFIYFFVIR